MLSTLRACYHYDELQGIKSTTLDGFQESVYPRTVGVKHSVADSVPRPDDFAECFALIGVVSLTELLIAGFFSRFRLFRHRFPLRYRAIHSTF
jgi:hypothetical protein